MGKNVLSLRELSPERFRESRKPSLGAPILSIHSIEVFIVDINTVEVVLLDPSRHGVGGVGRIRSSGGWGVG